jgi:hypothetical protein
MRKLGLLTLVGLWGVAAPAMAREAGEATCQSPPPARCATADCPRDVLANPGAALDPKTGRRFFLDYPCDLKPGEKVTFILNLHGGGSIGNWQRHYFPALDYVQKHRLVVATPTAATATPARRWVGEADDAHLQNISELVFAKFGAANIKAFWLAGHSQGGMTSRRIICSDYFGPRVDGFLSLSGGRVGGPAPRAPNAGRPPQRTAAAQPAPSAATPAPTAAPAAAQPDPTCEFSHIFAIGEHEIAALPQISQLAVKYGCTGPVRRYAITDTKAGQVYDSGHQDPGSKSWGLLPRPGTAQVTAYQGCRDGRLVADVVRVDKGHTEGLEPKVTEELVRLLTSAAGGKAQRVG